jgi:hypothetical protein
MKALTVNQKIVFDWAYFFHWASMEDFVRAIAPDKKRVGGVEYSLKRLVEKRKLKARKVRGYGNKLFYSVVGSQKVDDYSITHGLYCTDALLRFHESKVGDYVSEREFRAKRFKPVPEFAVRYGEVAILFEYSTANNFKRKKLIEKKLQAYKEGMGKFERELSAKPILVYVIEAPEWEVDKLAARYERNDFFFCDSRMFYSTPTGEQLSKPIYTWRGEKVNLYA